MALFSDEILGAIISGLIGFAGGIIGGLILFLIADVRHEKKKKNEELVRYKICLESIAHELNFWKEKLFKLSQDWASIRTEIERHIDEILSPGVYCAFL